MPAVASVAEPAPSSTTPPRGVCVAIDTQGKPQRIEADTVGAFLDPLAKSSLSWVNFAVEDLKRDGSHVAGLLGFSGSLVEHLLRGPFTNYEDRDTEFGLRLPVVRVRGSNVDVLPLLVLVRWGLVLTLHESGKVHRMVRLSRYADVFMRKIPGDLPMPDKLTVVLTRLLNENNERNFDGLRVIQEQGDLIGANLLEAGRDRELVGRQIYDVKHLLVQYLDVLWSSLDVIHSLRYGDAELVSDDETLLSRMGILADDITRQIQLAEHTTEVLVSGLEVLQSMYNNQLQILNNRLALVVAWLTILGTVILVPNTMATMFGPLTDRTGVSFWAYLGGLVGVTVGATWFAYSWVRRKGLLPQKVD